MIPEEQPEWLKKWVIDAGLTKHPQIPMKVVVRWFDYTWNPYDVLGYSEQLKRHETAKHFVKYYPSVWKHLNSIYALKEYIEHSASPIHIRKAQTKLFKMMVNING